MLRTEYPEHFSQRLSWYVSKINMGFMDLINKRILKTLTVNVFMYQSVLKVTVYFETVKLTWHWRTNKFQEAMIFLLRYRAPFWEQDVIWPNWLHYYLHFHHLWTCICKCNLLKEIPPTTSRYEFLLWKTKQTNKLTNKQNDYGSAKIKVFG